VCRYIAVEPARGFMCWPVNPAGHSRSLVFWLGRIYVENGRLGSTLDVSTLPSSFRAFFAAFFAFFIVFRTAFVFLDIRSGPPTAFMA
jgi:hypothetical protein